MNYREQFEAMLFEQADKLPDPFNQKPVRRGFAA